MYMYMYTNLSAGIYKLSKDKVNILKCWLLNNFKPLKKKRYDWIWLIESLVQAKILLSKNKEKENANIENKE